MTKKEAYEILGLQEGASEKEVLERYYDLLKKIILTTEVQTGSQLVLIRQKKLF